MSKNRHAWHPADVRAALEKRGLTYADVARRHDLAESTVRYAARAKSHAGEQAIAAELGIPAQTIWPDRYDDDGTPRHKRIRRKSNAANGGGHVAEARSA